MEILGINYGKYQNEILNEISLYLFDNTIQSGGKKTFDLIKDYQYYYTDFLEYGIDLNTDDISWWKFNAILRAIFLKEHSTINSVLKFRTWEKPSKNGKREETAYNSYMNKMRSEYSLDKKKDIQNNLKNLVESARAKSEKNKRGE